MEWAAVEKRVIESPDGVKTVASMVGAVSGPRVILIHGVLHSRLIWSRQFADPSLAPLRLVAYDVRGHGEADKPIDDPAYDGERYADELAAVIAATGVDKPVIVGWSLGSRVMFNYFAKHGSSQVLGVMIIGARMHVVPRTSNVPISSNLHRACDDDLDASIRARRAFILDCHAAPPPPSDFIDMVASAMVVPPRALRRMVGRPLDNRAALASLSVPVHVAQGARDLVCKPDMIAQLTDVQPNARVTLYEASGHSPFYEEAPRFNRDLLDFVHACRTRADSHGDNMPTA